MTGDRKSCVEKWFNSLAVPLSPRCLTHNGGLTLKKAHAHRNVHEHPEVHTERSTHTHGHDACPQMKCITKRPSTNTDMHTNKLCMLKLSYPHIFWVKIKA